VNASSFQTPSTIFLDLSNHYVPSSASCHSLAKLLVDPALQSKDSYHQSSI
jgi:hypothetical protein